jgi:hypothetical protein
MNLTMTNRNHQSPYRGHRMFTGNMPEDDTGPSKIIIEKIGETDPSEDDHLFPQKQIMTSEPLMLDNPK